jgi:hypothetical protein
MSLKTKKGVLETKLKTNPKPTQIEQSMRALNAKFEPFDTADVPAGAWNGEVRQGSELSGWWKSGGLAENTKNVETKLRST